MKLKLFTTVFTALTLASGFSMACMTEGRGAPHFNGGGWVADTARVDDNAYVGPGAVVCDNAKVFAPAIISDNASVAGNAVIRGNSSILDTARVRGNARVINAMVVGGEVYGNAKILNKARVDDSRAKVYGDAKVEGANTHVSEYAEVFGTAVVRGSVIRGYAKIDCGRWIGVKVFDDKTGQCGRNGQDKNSSSENLGGVLSNPISDGNTQSVAN